MNIKWLSNRQQKDKENNVNVIIELLLFKNLIKHVSNHQKYISVS